MIFVGADVHVRNSYLCVKDKNGRILKKGRIGNTLGEIAAFMGSFEPEPLRVSLESTTNSRAICRMWREYGREAGLDLTAEVLHARKLRVIAESVTKCDRMDAAILADLTRANLRLPVCYLPDEEEFALREHLRAREDRVQMRTRLKNRFHSVFHRRGIQKPTNDLFTKSGRRWLAEVELDEADRVLVDRTLALVDRFTEEIDWFTKELKVLARRPRWAKPAVLLQSMPGVGLITAMTVLAELGDITRFRSRASVANYAGLTPVVRSSDSKTWMGGITRRGSSHLRAVLGEAAWVAIRSAPVYGAMYDRIYTRRGAQKAIVAVARRMMEDMFTMLIKDQAFRFESPGTPGSPHPQKSRHQNAGIPSSPGRPSDRGSRSPGSSRAMSASRTEGGSGGRTDSPRSGVLTASGVAG